MTENNDPSTRRMHQTPRSAIANLVENLRAEGWTIELDEDEHGQVIVFAEALSATEEWT